MWNPDILSCVVACYRLSCGWPAPGTIILNCQSRDNLNVAIHSTLNNIGETQANVSQITPLRVNTQARAT